VRIQVASGIVMLGVLVASCGVYGADERGAGGAPGGPSGDPRSTAEPIAVDARAHETLPWAFVLDDPRDPAAPAPDPNEVVTVPGSSLSLRRGSITIANGPPDWHPDGHPPMPDIVARGGGEGVMPCGYCHLPNGQGKPENSSLAGQPYVYLVQQLEDFRNGLRRTGEPRMAPPALMTGIGSALSEADARVAAAYFASMEYRPWIRVVETDSVPRTRFAGWIHEVVEGAGAEPIGVRVVEVPEDLQRTRLRDDASGFVAYVPRGAVARGEALALTGDAGRTVACTICHGADLRGTGPVPALAGRSPSYMARQLFDLRTGHRDGAWSDLMDRTVADLTVADVVDVVAYLASLEP
jgi:cytochrome c553